MKRIAYIILFFALLLSAKMQSQTTQLTVKGFSEGYFRPSTGKMMAVIDSVNYPMICDTGFLQVIDTSSMQAVFCTDVVIKTDGYGSCDVPAYLIGQYCLVSIKFKNTYHLLSKNTVRMTGNAITVDLTIRQNVCCNFDTTHGVAKAFSGDVNQDGILDGADFLIIDADFQNQNTGYLISDLTGDGIVDSVDINMFNKNLSSGLADDFVGACAINGIQESEKFSFNVYPNPCKDFFMIEMDRVYENVHISIFDCLGRVSMNENFSNVSAFRIGTEKLQGGIYFIRIEADGIQKFEKAILVEAN